MNVEQALSAARALGLDRLDATLLLAHHLQQRRTWVLAHGQDDVIPEALAAFERDCARRADGVPLPYLTGRRDFMGLDLKVTPAVLVPRPETETLAQWAIECLAVTTAPCRVVDLGTGSGALALAIASACPTASITATDRSAEALAVARANAQALGLQVQFEQGDWWHAVAAERFGLAVANPPYIADGDPHLPALRHEPSAALVADADGLAALRTIVAGAPAHLSGWLLLEHGWDQGSAVRGLLQHAGFYEVETRPDLTGHPRCSGGRIG